MKTLINLLALFLIMNFSFAQSPENNFQQHGYSLDVYDLSGNRIAPNANGNLTGSPLLNEQWKTGAVVLENGQRFSNLLLQFNLESNRLYFKHDSTTYSFASNVSTFKINDALFRSGYPDRKGNPTSFLYRVVTDGPKVQYLMEMRAAIDQHYVYGSAAQSKYVITEQMYMYDVLAKKMTKVSFNKKSVEAALPEYAAQIAKFPAGNNTKFQDEKQIDSLVTKINYVN
jgi:hypothetical protein